MYAALPETGQAELVVFNEAVTAGSGIFDFLTDGKAFHDRPPHAVGLDHILDGAYSINRPDLAYRHTVQ